MPAPIYNTYARLDFENGVLLRWKDITSPNAEAASRMVMLPPASAMAMPAIKPPSPAPIIAILSELFCVSVMVMV